MDTQKIRFIRNRAWLSDDSPSSPCPMIKTLPEWYRKADRYGKDQQTGQHFEMPGIGGKIPSWKACPAVFDVMGTGYTLRTPCDIEFNQDAAGNISAKVADTRYESFLLERLPMPQFVNPSGYNHKHFAWWPDWAVELPPGYSALYTQPMNRFELPFLTVSGIIDNDKVNQPGTMPFFLLRGVSGYLPAGTPYAQIIPFKREHWQSELDTSLSEQDIRRNQEENSRRYRQPDGGVYQKEVWEHRKYL